MEDLEQEESWFFIHLAKILVRLTVLLIGRSIKDQVMSQTAATNLNAEMAAMTVSIFRNTLDASVNTIYALCIALNEKYT